MSAGLVIGGVSIPPGTRQVVRIPVTRDLDGGEVNIWVHVVHGAKPGPTLGLFGVQHGDEWIDIPLIRATVESLDPQAMSGTLLAVPVCNPISLGNVQRNTQPESDGPDMNRVWPGANTWLAESMTKVMAEQVVKHCTALIDYHLGPWGSAFAATVYGQDYTDASMVQKSRDIAVAFGYSCVEAVNAIAAFPGPRALTAYAATALGIPGIVAEIGGAGFGEELESAWLAENVKGTRNVMRYMGILNEPLEKPKRILFCDKAIRINPTVGGLLVPEREPDELLREVKKGELLAQVVSPYTLETIERLESPCDGYLFYMCRSYPVRPGNWGFGVLPKTNARWESL